MKRWFTIAYVWYATGERGVEYIRASSAEAAVAAMEAKPNADGNLFIAAVFEGVVKPVIRAAALPAEPPAGSPQPDKARYIVAVVHRELTHYAVDAASDDDALEKAKISWVEQQNEVSLGSEFADIERIYVDQRVDGDVEQPGNE
jgi:hypothetical protein